jgi:hypothetical protein
VDIKEVVTKLKAMQDQVPEKLKDATQVMAFAMEHHAKYDVPAPVLSGAYRSSIQAKVLDRRGSGGRGRREMVRIDLSAGDPSIKNRQGQPTTMYAYLLEAGHSKQAPHGVIGPTFKKFQNQLDPMVQEAVLNVVKRLSKK